MSESKTNPVPKRPKGGLPDYSAEQVVDEFIIKLVAEESKLKVTDPFALIVYLVEKYHPLFSQEKRGRPNKWTPLVKAILAVEVDMAIETDDEISTRRDAIINILARKEWKKMRPSSGNGGFDMFVRYDKAIRSTDPDFYNSIKSRRKKYLTENEKNQWSKFVARAIVHATKKDLNQKN